MSIILPAPELAPGPRSALVIATGAYADERLGGLRAPAQDAGDLAAVLGDPRIGGFAVTVLQDRGVHELRMSVERFPAGREPKEIVAVYVSCHGVLSPRRRLYFAAADTDEDLLAATGLDARWLIECLDECRARRQVVILDCCFSGAFALAKGAKGPQDVGLEAQFGLDEGRGRVVLTASRATEYSFEGEELADGAATGSVFTAALVEGLRTGAADKDGDGYVSVTEAYAYAYARVRMKGGTAQTPQRWVYGGEGEVMLARSAAGILVKPAPLPEDLQAGLESRYPRVRIGTVEELAGWLTDANPARMVAARVALEEVGAQDIPVVAEVARGHLLRHPTPDAAREIRLMFVERLAHTIADSNARAISLLFVAGAVAGSDPARAQRLADEAEQLVQASDGKDADDEAFANALIEIVRAKEPTDLDNAEQVLQELTDEEWKAVALAFFAKMVTGRDLARAQRLSDEADLIARAEQKWLLVFVAAAVAEWDPARAERLARGFDAPEDLAEKTWLLATVAWAVSRRSPAQAERIAVAAEQLARAVTEENAQAGAMALVAGAGDNSDRIRRLIDDVEQLNQALADNDDKVFALALAASAAVEREPERARRLADEAESLVRTGGNSSDHILALMLAAVREQW